MFISGLQRGTWNFSYILTTSPWPTHPSFSNSILSITNMSCKSTLLHGLNCYHDSGGPRQLSRNCNNYSVRSSCHGLLRAVPYAVLQSCPCLETHEGSQRHKEQIPSSLEGLSGSPQWSPTPFLPSIFFHYSLCWKLAVRFQAPGCARLPGEAPPILLPQLLRLGSPVKDQTLITCQGFTMRGVTTWLGLLPSSEQN